MKLLSTTENTAFDTGACASLTNENRGLEPHKPSGNFMLAVYNAKTHRDLNTLQMESLRFLFFFTEDRKIQRNNMQPNSWLGELGCHTVQFFFPPHIHLYIFLYKICWILPLKILKRKTLLNWYPDLSNLGLSALTAILQAEALKKVQVSTLTSQLTCNKGFF